jgi:predicted AAA+ superfamily ATPase
MRLIASEDARFIIFCDDLSFDKDETSYKSLKTILDGGLEGRPDNVLFYATSNRRHLMPRDMIENERSTAISPGEAVDEKMSLSDRFGLWLGFHNCDQDTFLAMVRGYCDAYGLDDFRRRPEGAGHRMVGDARRALRDAWRSSSCGNWPENRARRFRPSPPQIHVE